MRPFWIPLITTAFMLSAAISAYAMSVLAKHVAAVWPFISDTGTFVPESGVFGILLNYTAAFGAITIYLRYLQVSQYQQFRNGWEKRPNRCWVLFYRVSFLIGLAAAFGMTLVANFQWTNYLLVHMIGALLTFGLGSVYLWCHAIISYLRTSRDSLCMAHTRVLLAILSSGSFVYLQLAMRQLTRIVNENKIDRLFWDADEPHYAFYLTVTYSEWLMALALLLSLFSYAYELRNMEFVDIKLSWKGDDVVNTTRNLTYTRDNNNKATNGNALHYIYESDNEAIHNNLRDQG